MVLRRRPMSTVVRENASIAARLARVSVQSRATTTMGTSMVSSIPISSWLPKSAWAESGASLGEWWPESDRVVTSSVHLGSVKSLAASQHGVRKSRQGLSQGEQQRPRARDLEWGRRRCQQLLFKHTGLVLAHRVAQGLRHGPFKPCVILDGNQV